MRILQLRFRNLNSLAGEWIIDFSRPEFTADGIFLISGPTGAGKSTILDALCLALYGCTPRLNKISKNSNEILSRQTGECFAEVTFETQAGCFRSHWSQHRARRHPTGELQAPKHELADAASGKILETKIQDVARRIERIAGMDFDRFTRSMLLAQGGFAAFLQADPDERAPILEQITGTEIYSRISISVHERNRKEREQLNLLQAEIAGITLLSSEQENELQNRLDEQQKQADAITGKLQQTGKALAWLTGIAELRAEIEALQTAFRHLAGELETFKPERERLNRALKAAELDGSHAALTAARQQQAEDQRMLEQTVSRLPELTALAQQKQAALTNAGHWTAQARQTQKDAAPLIHKIRILDQQLLENEKRIGGETVYCQRAADQIAADTALLAQHQQKLAAAQAALAQIQEYQQANTQDERLISDFAAIEAQLGNLIAAQQDYAARKMEHDRLQAQRDKTTQALPEAAKVLKTCQQVCVDVQQQIEAGQNNLQTLLNNRLLREYRAEKENLLREMALLNIIASLERERKRLEDGKPCPLCGSTAHPYAAGTMPQPDAAEQKIAVVTAIIEKAETLEAEIAALGKSAKSALDAAHEAEKRVTAMQQTRQNIEENLAGSAAALAACNQRCADLQQSAHARLYAYGLPESLDTDVAVVLSLLNQRLQRWQASVKQKIEIELQINVLNSELKRLAAVIETRNQALSEKQQALNALRETVESRKAERRQWFGEHNPDSEESRLEQAAVAAEQVEKNARAAENEARQQWNAATAQIDALKTRIEKNTAALQTLEASFSNELRAAEFADEHAFSACRLTPEERERLKADAKALDDRQIDVRARLQDRETRLAQEIEKNLSIASREALELDSAALDRQAVLLRDAIAGIRHQLQTNQAAVNSMQAKLAGIAAQKHECSRWERLHDLVGSADGKKYRNFAQGLTFEIVIDHANRQLQKLTDRYLLVHDRDKPLALNVIDSYQAGEIRSTRNLSGGESFIVSLALALGLSRMASRNVRIDSLFLDEGFGTLDEEALDTALDMLASLQQDGKLIGVISHVPMLKVRISTQIEVIPQTGGRSRVVGPGIQCLGSGEVVV
ncbi:MAG: AAA family ATPase [Nitrosomonas sp.]|nr:AAA family ATPase [Nitrosomonas sp.]